MKDSEKDVEGHIERLYQLFKLFYTVEIDREIAIEIQVEDE